MDIKLKDTGLSAILPAYNDEKSIKAPVQSLVEYLKPVVKNLEIVIVEDASPDRTAQVCDELSRAYPEVRVIHHKCNMGYGRTLRDGFVAASEELVFYTDGDNQYDIRELLSALAIFRQKNIDALFGFRHPRGDGFVRFLVSRVYNLLFRMFFWVKVRDVNCSFKLIKRGVLMSLELTSESAFIDGEIVWQLKRKGFSFLEMAVTNFSNKARRSNFINPKLTLSMLNEMFRKRFFS